MHSHLAARHDKPSIPTTLFMTAAPRHSICIAVLLLIASITCIAQRTTRRHLLTGPLATDSVSAIKLDTVASPGRLLTISGYEKPLRSTRETLHITNNDTVRTLRSVSIDIIYTDIDGTQIHRRTVDLSLEIPPGETKMIAFKSWDVQNRFFYSGGPKPRIAAYPYTIRITPLSAVYLPTRPIIPHEL